MVAPTTENEAKQEAVQDSRLAVEPMDPGIDSIQPGGGMCMRIELAWGWLRRWYLKIFRRGYVRRMGKLRHGEPDGCPHEVLDPRDLKYHQNRVACHWSAQDDPFTWRDRLPVARVGLVELVVLGGTCAVLTIAGACWYWPAAIVPALIGLFLVWFFRDPPRVAPQDAALVVSPADGKVVVIDKVDHDPYVGGPAVVVGIFLSVFNVHINRAPIAARVIGLSYRRGKFLNAMRSRASRENEQMTVRLEQAGPPYRRMIVRQIAGAIARRIVCWIRPGQHLECGAQFGMIKLGSRTELVLPAEPDLVIQTRVGAHVQAGTSVLARYGPRTEDD